MKETILDLFSIFLTNYNTIIVKYNLWGSQLTWGISPFLLLYNDQVASV